MTSRSQQLIRLAQEFVSEVPFNVVYASVGGSTGRGEADQYSDLDIVIYTDDISLTDAKNVMYKDEIIQLEIEHCREFPKQKNIIDNPWDYRFLQEICIIYDSDGEFKKIKNWAIQYFSSAKGTKRISEQVLGIVEERKNWALHCMNQGNMYSATHAALGAWTEAAFLYLFLTQGSLSTNALIPSIQKLERHFAAFKTACPFTLNGQWSEIPAILKRFRSYLRKQGFSFEFGLSPIQDLLYEKKAARLLESKEYMSLLWQCYGEAFCLYAETSENDWFEDYFYELPESLQQDLRKIGFVPLPSHKIQTICTLSDELINLVYHEKNKKNISLY
ncbi:Nucleotidyltransferase domain-containing protein [Aneurinibacillus thermoaerophilus]|uniref:Nucleotidyltransferase domain-containing protein n=1 Tax=Aneurinibacillus thermoaerophilus TaxID=143495 RepID=A0A1G8CP86_ANETH|nr:Nucleotidyltransferase domain-containing protein [Aneurinibacillus thermoaerophilus]